MPPLGWLLQMRSGRFGENWSDALRRKGLYAVGGDQHWPTGAQSTLQGIPPAPMDKCGCAWGLQGYRGTPRSPI